jgi:hypothetical protein
MLKSSSIFKRNGAHLVEKGAFEKKEKKIVHSQSLSALNMQFLFGFVSSSEHIKFIINGKYYEKHYDNPNYYASLMIFQTYKNVVLWNVHSFWWLL